MSRRSGKRKQQYSSSFPAPYSLGFSRPILSGPQIKRSFLPARVLVGWIFGELDARYLCGDHRPSPSPELLHTNNALIRTGRRLRERLPTAHLGSAVADLPPEFGQYVARLLGDPTVRQKLASGYQLALIDLLNVCSLQPLVSLSKVASMMASLDPTDPLSVARLTLPMTFIPKLIIPSMAVNAFTMRVAGVWTPAPLAMAPMHVHVARVNGRFVLTDGYHRTYALLKLGITSCPGFYREARDFGELGMPPGLLPERLLNIARPPMLTDFLVEGLAVDIPA